MHVHVNRCRCIECRGFAMAAALKLISHKLCPYVQRAVIALTEKGIPFERIDIDLAEQAGLVSEDFAARQGAGAAGRDRGRRGGAVREQRDLRIHRGDARRRKTASAGSAASAPQHRAWMEFGSAILGDLWGLETTGDPAVFESKRQALAAKFAQVEKTPRRGAIFCRREFQPGGCGVRADLPLFRRVRPI